MMGNSAIPPLRCGAVWACVMGIASALARWGWAPATQGPRPSVGEFTDGLERVAGIACLGCAAWLGLTTTLVTIQLARGRQDRVRGCPRLWQRALVVACGLALATVLTDPGRADDAHPARTPVLARLLDGLAVPDRAEDGPRARPEQQPRARTGRPAPPTPPPGASPRGLVLVKPGDSLWTIADDELPTTATTAEISERWRAIYAANRARIGPDPDLIHPGMSLLLPPPRKD